MKHYVLASASPRRRQLLTELGLSFTQAPADINEDPLPGETPLATQKRITQAKAATFRMTQPEQVVIACDTTVLLDGEMLNKPSDAEEAWAMLRRLRGRAHQVQSCLVIRQAEQVDLDIITSDVQMRAYGDDEIAGYIASGDPFDKAGSYAVQHPGFQPVDEIRGCPLNVIGLALCHLRARVAGLPACAPVCESWFGAICPSKLGDLTHRVSGQRKT